MHKRNRDIQILGEMFYNSRKEEDFHALYKVLKPSLLYFLENRYGSSKHLTSTDIEDCVSDALVIIYLNIHQYKNFYRFSTWSFTIAKNELLRTLLKRKSKKETSLTNMDESLDFLYSIYLNNPAPILNNQIENVISKNQLIWENLKEVIVERTETNKKYPDFHDYIQENKEDEDIYGFYELTKQEKLDIMRDKVIAEISKLHERYRKVVWDRDVNNMSYNDISEKHSIHLNTCKVYIHKGRKIIRNKLQQVYDEWKTS